MTKSTITREQLEEWVEQFDEDGGCDATDRQLEALIRQSLAVMDGEPVAWTDEQELRDVDRCGCGYLFTVNPVTPHADERRIILLYRHAQPEPVVPDGYVMVPKEPTEAMCDISHIGVDVYCGITDDNEYYSIGGAEAAKVWKAMLAAAQQSPGSEPATVPGKWIPVSELMPEDEQEVLTINRMGHCFVSFFDKHSGLFFDRIDAPAACCIEHVLVTHWMPLPAAPQERK